MRFDGISSSASADTLDPPSLSALADTSVLADAMELSVFLSVLTDVSVSEVFPALADVSSLTEASVPAVVSFFTKETSDRHRIMISRILIENSNRNPEQLFLSHSGKPSVVPHTLLMNRHESFSCRLSKHLFHLTRSVPFFQPLFGAGFGESPTSLRMIISFQHLGKHRCVAEYNKTCASYSRLTVLRYAGFECFAQILTASPPGMPHTRFALHKGPTCS